MQTGTIQLHNHLSSSGFTMHTYNVLYYYNPLNETFLLDTSKYFWDRFSSLSKICLLVQAVTLIEVPLHLMDL